MIRFRLGVMGLITFFMFLQLFFGQSSSLVFAQTCPDPNISNPNCHDGSYKSFKTVYLDIKILEKTEFCWGCVPPWWVSTPAIDANEVENDVDRANEIWQYAGFEFIIKNIQTIPEDGFWNILPLDWPELKNLLGNLFSKNGDNNSINIYYVNEIKPHWISPDSPPPAGVTVDYCNPAPNGYTGIAMTGDAEDTDGFGKRSNTLAHELGHMLLCQGDEADRHPYPCNIMSRVNIANKGCLSKEQVCRARTFVSEGVGSIWGLVTDNISLLKDASVSLYGKEGNFIISVLTDGDGVFIIRDITINEFSLNEYFLQIEKDGYLPLRWPVDETEDDPTYFYIPLLGENTCNGFLGDDFKLQPCFYKTPIPLQVNQPAIEGFVCQHYYQRYKFDLTKNGNTYIITVTPYDSGNLFLYYSDTLDRLEPLDAPSWTDCSNAYECSSARQFKAGEKKVITFFTPDTGGDPNSAFIAIYGVTDVDYKVEVISIPVISLEMNLPAGWSMISLPVKPQDTKLSALFPKAEVVYSYEKGAGYVRIPNNKALEVGKGYWILSYEDQNSVLTGQSIPSYADTVSEDGWSMIGGCSSDAKISTSGCKIGVIYKYVLGSGYQRVPTSEPLEPCHGYWILFQDVVGQCQFTVEQNNHEEWQDIVDDTRLTFNSASSRFPSLGVDSSGNIHIAWADHRDGNDEIYYTKLDNNGNTLVDDTRLTFSVANSDSPSLGIDSSGNIHIAWVDYRINEIYYEIYYTKLDNNGNTLVDDLRLTYIGALCSSVNLGLDGSDNVHIVWGDERNGNYNYEIYYTKLNNNGNTLVDDKRLTFDSGYSGSPSLGVDNAGNIHIVWGDERNGNYNYEIYYTKLNNNGNTLVDDTRLTFGDGTSYFRGLGVDNFGNIHIAWVDFRNNTSDIYYTKLNNNGNTLVDDTRLTFGGNDTFSPSLRVDSSGNIHIAWADFRLDGNYDIYYTKLNNNGNTLVDNTRLTSDSGHSYYHSLGVDSAGSVHITWVDSRDGNYEIYYTKGKTIPK